MVEDALRWRRNEMNISTIIMAVALVIEFIAAVGSMKLYKEANEQKEWLKR